MSDKCMHMAVDMHGDLVSMFDDYNKSSVKYYCLRLRCDCKSCGIPMQFVGATLDSARNIMKFSEDWPFLPFGPTVREDGFELIIPLGPPDMVSRCDNCHGSWQLNNYPLPKEFIER